jgi:hypothetical protein
MSNHVYESIFHEDYNNIVDSYAHEFNIGLQSKFPVTNKSHNDICFYKYKVTISSEKNDLISLSRKVKYFISSPSRRRKMI